MCVCMRMCVEYPEFCRKTKQPTTVQVYAYSVSSPFTEYSSQNVQPTIFQVKLLVSVNGVGEFNFCGCKWVATSPVCSSIHATYFVRPFFQVDVEENAPANSWGGSYWLSKFFSPNGAGHEVSL